VCRYFCTRMRVIGVNIGRDVGLALGSRLCYPPIISGRARVVPEWASAMPARLAARPHLADAGLFLWLLDTWPTFFHHHAPTRLMHSRARRMAVKRTFLWKRGHFCGPPLALCPCVVGRTRGFETGTAKSKQSRKPTFIPRVNT
jgi:hypothetical protein